MSKSFHSRPGGWFGDYRRPRAEPAPPAKPDELMEPVVIVEPPPIRCPQCKSVNIKIYGTDKKVNPVLRYRVCRNCGYKFQSIQPLM